MQILEENWAFLVIVGMNGLIYTGDIQALLG